MKIILEANLSLRDKRFLGGVLVVVLVLSVLATNLLIENRDLSSKLQDTKVSYNALLDTHESLQRNQTKLIDSRNQLFDRLNQTVTLERKYWEVSGENVTLRPKDTLAITIHIDNPSGYMGIDGIDRLEITWIGIYSPNLTRGQMRNAIVDQYIGPDGFTERWIGEKAIAFGSHQDATVVRHPISPNETIARESVTSTTFFFENYNYLGYMRPGTSITIKLFYDGGVYLTIRELEFYLVGFVNLKLGEAENFNSGWIGTNVEYEIRHYGEMP